MGAIAGAAVILFNEIEAVLEVVGVVAASQFLAKKLLFAEDRKRTAKELKCACAQPGLHCCCVCVARSLSWHRMAQARQDPARGASALDSAIAQALLKALHMAACRSLGSECRAAVPQCPKQISWWRAVLCLGLSKKSRACHRRREIIDDKIAAGEAGDDLKKLAATIITIDEPENGTGAIKVRTVNRGRPCRRGQGRRTGQRP